jgi:hypothetical protein
LHGGTEENNENLRIGALRAEIEPETSSTVIKEVAEYRSRAMMEAASTSETSVNFYETTRRNNPEDSHLHTRCCENLKSHSQHLLKYKQCPFCDYIIFYGAPFLEKHGNLHI